MTTQNNTDLHNAMLAEYTEACANFRQLADIRFKILGFLPIGAVVGVVFSDKLGHAQSIIALFGLIVTVALAAYNARNDQHYGELAGRAAELERKLGLYRGIFNQRPGRWRFIGIGNIKVEHGWPIRLIYQASCGIWLYIVITKVISKLDDIFLSGIFSSHVQLIHNRELVISISSIIIVILVIWIFTRRLKKYEEGSKRQAEESVKIFVNSLKGMEAPVNSSNENETIIEAVSNFPAKPGSEALRRKSKEERKREKTEKAEKKLKYYLALPLFNGDDSEPLKKQDEASTEKLREESAVYLTSILLKMPARWIQEKISGRT